MVEKKLEKEAAYRKMGDSSIAPYAGERRKSGKRKYGMRRRLNSCE